MTDKCSGILFITKSGKGLFLKRSDEHGPQQYRGLWGLPGGHLDDGETHEEAAIRECMEEIGQRPDGNLFEINRQISTVEGDDKDVSKEIDYLTYAQLIDHEFIPELNPEHSEFLWAPLEAYPEPIHPGLKITLKKLTADELEIAEMMIKGEVASPQKYMNLWLFAIRVTGTGLSYRSGLDEYVWRDSSIYLNERFLKRCQGLPVIFEHPKSATLNTKEYVERNIGSIFLPYIKDEDVWAIVKVWDTFAAKIMAENILSTSPAVVLTGDDKYMVTNNDKVLLIEGKPKLLDHLAICQVGVWDKRGPPKGVTAVTTGDLVMADGDDKAAALEAARKEKHDAQVAADKAKKDADEAEIAAKGGGGGSAAVLDKTLKCLDSLASRFDAFEEKEKERETKRADKKARKDAERAAKDADFAARSDKAKKDAEEEAEKKKVDAAAKAKADADKAKADAEDEVRKRIADVEARLPKQMTDADYAAMADSQVKADRICLMHGQRAARPLDGETHLAYRRRLASGLKEHSPAWKGIDLNVIADDAAFTNVERTIYADAETAGLNPVAPAEDFLREIVEPDVTGRKISTFVGRPSAWMKEFAPNRRRLIGIRNH